MKNAIALWGLLFLSLSSCSDEEPLLAEVQKVVEVNFDLSNNRTNSQGDASLSATTDFVKEDFEEYLNQIRDFEVNAFMIQFQSNNNLPTQQGASVLFEELGITLNSLQSGNQSVSLLNFSGFELQNGVTSMTLFHKDSTGTDQITHAMSFVRSRLLREEAFNWDVDVELEGLEPNGYVEIKLLLDLTAEVILP